MARHSDPDTSHMAAAHKSENSLWIAIRDDLRVNGPGTEETILNRLGLEQRSSGSSCFARMVRAGWVANLIDPVTKKHIKLRNKSGELAMVRGLPSHQAEHLLIHRLCTQMDEERSQPKTQQFLTS
jgi:hypothetical protein